MDEKKTKKSIIDRILEDKKKEKVEKEQIQRDYEIRVQRMRAKMNTYASSIIKKLEKNKPLYTPRGRWIGDARWSTESDVDGFKSIAKEKISMKLLTMGAAYAQPLNLKKVNDLFSQATMEIDNSLFNPSIFLCFVVDDCENEKIKHIFSTFDHYGFFPLLYSINQERLWYNSSSDFIDYFVPWFDPQKTPVRLYDLILSLSDEHNIITLKSIQNHFIFDRDEAEKMIHSLEKKNVVYHLKGTEYGVNE